MPLIVDGIIFSLQRQGGISVYFRQLLSRLVRDRVATSMTLHSMLMQEAPSATGTLKILLRPSRLLERYRQCEIPHEHAVFHSSYYRKPSDSTMPTVVTVHDFTYERCLTGPRRWIHSAQKFAAIRAAKAVICISESTRQDLLELVGEIPGQQLQVIHNGVAEDFTPIELPKADRSFILFVGQRRGYKNFNLALRAMAWLPDWELHCVGGGPLVAEEMQGVPEAVRQRVRYLGFVTDAHLNKLYNQAVCLLYPSSYEGFGIPVIEAMRAGCPVLCTNCRAVLEIGDQALTVVPADDARAVADAMVRVASPDHRASLVRAGLAVAHQYSWERTYQQTLQIYRSLAPQ